MSKQDDWIQIWIDNRFGVPNTVNKQAFVDIVPVANKRERERIINKVKQLTRWDEEWEWMSPAEDGQYVEYKDVWQALKED